MTCSDVITICLSWQKEMAQEAAARAMAAEWLAVDQVHGMGMGEL